MLVIHINLSFFVLFLEAEIVAEAMPILRTMFGNAFPEPKEVVIPDWISDRYTYGTYSNWPVG